MLSPTISVRPSGVMTVPFGKLELVGRDPRAAVGLDGEEVRLAPTARRRTCRSRSCRRTRGPARRPPCRCSSPGASVERSACSTSVPPSSRRTLRSSIDTTSMRPSGSQPSPTVGSAPRRSSRRCRRRRSRRRGGRAVGEAQPAVVPARAFGERETVEETSQVRVHGSGPYSSGRSDGTDVVEALLARLGQARHEEDRGEQRARCRSSAIDAADAAERIRERARRAARPDDRAEHADDDAAARSTCRAPRWGTARRRACRARCRPPPT